MSFVGTDSIDMRASLGQELDYYDKKTYKPEYAIAEFVDNSVASYLVTKPLLQIIEPGFKLRIEITYDPIAKTLEVKDNAGGMSKETFKNALVLGKAPTNTSGLNEFGWGLKTAASWFGKKWSVRSTTFDDDNEFYALVDIKSLLKTGQNDVPITIRRVEPNSHYTIVKISSLMRTISNSNISKLRLQLASIYRRFLVKKEISILFNGEPLEYEEPAMLETVEDGVPTTWKLYFDDIVKFDGREYPISGYIGLLKEGSYKNAGLTLIRRNRVVIGGYENGFKPTEIFGSANSFQSLRLVGEINMDKWPVTQAKDNFDWDLNGLKEEFIEKIKFISKDYIAQAINYRAKEKKNPITPIKVQEIADETRRNIEKMDPSTKITIRKEMPPVKVRTDSDGISIPSIMYPISIAGTDYEITVEYICDPEVDLISVTPNLTDPRKITVSFNTVFPMFYALKTNSYFIKAIQKFFVALVIAEEQTLKVSDNGKTIYPAELRDNLNQILIQMSNDGDFADE